MDRQISDRSPEFHCGRLPICQVWFGSVEIMISVVLHIVRPTHNKFAIINVDGVRNIVDALC